MNWYDTLLFLHVLAAFVLVAAVVLFGAFYVATGRSQGSPVLLLAPLADLLAAIGGLAVIVFGIWLAIYLSAYHPWDGWIVAAIVLWVLGNATGNLGGRRDERTAKLAQRLASEGDVPSTELQARVRDPVSLALSYGSGLIMLAVLGLMIWKPGA